MYYVRYSIIYANYNIRWGNKHYLFRRKRTNFYFTFVILFFRSISPASFKRRNGMLVTCMRPWTKKSQFLMPKGSKRSDETIARPLPRWICWFFSKWFSKYFFFITNWFFFITLFYFRSDLGEIPSHFVRSKRCEFGEEVRAAAVSKVDGGSGVAAGFYFREGISRNEKLQTNGVRTCVVTRKVSSRSLLVKGERMADAVSALMPFTTEFQIKPGRAGVIRDLKQARTATAVNKQLNFTVKNKPHTTNYIYCIFEGFSGFPPSAK